MPVPPEILAVERPKNSIVYVYGKNKDHYGVKSRIGCKYVNGRNIPINGPTIGHIINGVYVPVDENSDVSRSSCDLKDWADYQLADIVFKEVLDELCAVYSRKDALKLYCIALIRVCQPHVKDYELQEAYETSFLSEMYPDVSLSKNTVCEFHKNVGKAYSKIVEFMRNRAAKVNIDHHLLVDGTLKSNESKINSLCDFSRKAKTKGTRDISVLYAFDLEEMEPICSKCFPGNMLDATSYSNFLHENHITKGLVIGDKGFPESAAHEEFKNNPDLHYMNPIKRNAKIIGKYHMYDDYEGVLKGYEGVTYKKVKTEKINKWLYCFRDSFQASLEEKTYLENAKKHNDFDPKAFREKQKEFGTIVLECDEDMPPEIAYKAYEGRWEIELVMRYYKHACEFDETRVHNDYSVIGSEFSDFLSTVLTFRMLKAFDKADLLSKMTYKRIMALLKRAKKVKLSSKADWELIRITKNSREVLQDLGILPKPEEQPKRKRGRPRKVNL